MYYEREMSVEEVVSWLQAMLRTNSEDAKVRAISTELFDIDFGSEGCFAVIVQRSPRGSRVAPPPPSAAADER